jgi:glutathione synthase/RimK-type ligase-like ATP-grasp enzyme
LSQGWRKQEGDVKSFLIATAANDIHAIIVAQALKQLGHECFRWVTSDYPTVQSCTVTYSAGTRINIEGVGVELSVDLAASELIFWNRRVIKEHFVSAELCDADRIIAATQSKTFIQGILPFFEYGCVCINKIQAATKAESKPFQLMMAKRAGFQIPETVITNNSSVIREFVERDGMKLLAKPFSPVVWKGVERDYVTRSAVVESSDLPENELLQACPMIFQAYVEKSYEVRITCFGDLPVAVRLNSQEIPGARVDWRAVSPTRLGVDRIALPDRVTDACVRLLRSLDLAFGCIDMIVTPNNDWVFLEVNQMGQFLWVEEINPDVPMLDLFVQLLTGVRRLGQSERLYGLTHRALMASSSAELRAEQPLRAPKVGVNVTDDTLPDGPGGCDGH